MKGTQSLTLLDIIRCTMTVWLLGPANKPTKFEGKENDKKKKEKQTL